MSSSGKSLGRVDAPPRRKMPAGETLLLSGSLLSLVASCVLWSARKQEWVDEIYTWTEVNDRSLPHLLSAIQHGADGGMPLFYTTAWAWARMFGSGTLMLRLYSCLALCGALLVLWRTVRRAYGVRATALGLLMVWGTSALILDQNAEARYYGLYMLMAAVVVALFARLAEQENTRAGVLAGAMLAQAGLALAHVLGIIYGALILLALILFDAWHGRVRIKVYLLQAAGWLALLVWLPAIRASMAVGRPHGWIPMPTASGVFASYSFQLWLVPLTAMQRHFEGSSLPAICATLIDGLLHYGMLVLLAAALPALVVTLWRSGTTGSQETRSDHKIPLLTVAFLLLTFPLLLLAFSHLITPIFVPRYAMPSAMGLAILLVACADAMGVDRIRKTYSPAGVGWIVAVTVLVAMPVVCARLAGYPQINSEYLDVSRLDALVPRGVSVVVAWQHDFFKAMRYSERSDRPYLFLLDWPTALKGETEFVSDFHLMSNYRAAGYYSSNIEDRSHFVCTHPYFLVLDDQSMSWFSHAQITFPGLVSEVAAHFDEDRELIAVHRTGPLAACSAPQADKGS